MRQGESLLAKLCESEEPILVRNNRLYTAEQSSRRASLFIDDISYKTYESERLSNLESLWLDNHPEIIDDMEIGLEDMVNLAYENLVTVRQKREKRTTGYSRSRCKNRKSCLSEVLDGIFLVFNQSIYQLDCTLDYMQKPDIRLRVGKRVYRPVRKLNLKRVEKEYMRKLSKDAVKMKSNGKNRIKGKSRIGCTAKRGYYLFTLSIPEFIMRVRSSYFRFRAVDVCVRVKKRGFCIEGPAAVAGKYHHPFVFQSGEICYNTSRRFEPLSFGAKIESDEKAAEQIAYLLHEAKKTMESGYFQGVEPVERLTKKNFSREWLTRSEAVKSGVRIIKQ